MAPKLTLTFNKGAERELADRVERLKRRGRPIQLDPLERVVHFLRGTSSRATMALPAFYLFLQHVKIEMQSRLCWQWGMERGRRMLLEELPYAIGWL